MHKIDKKNLKKFLLKEKKNIKILDVGCGNGENLELIKSWGYLNIYGTDIAPQMVEECKLKNLNVVLDTDLASNNFDLILFSHVIEHIDYPDIIDFFEHFFSKIKKNGKVIIITPCLYNGFYNDIDHIKPYYPNGLLNCFSEKKMSRSYFSKFNLQLLDIYFRKEVIAAFDIRSGYINKLPNKLIVKFRRMALKLLNFILLGTISKTTGYAALFSVDYED
jgi:SAM-dependent methyltransferase|tara:strand:+ start:131 stop:790 length:660 start_codon:yes stop_codon:yes gene_type:complete